MAMDAVDDPDDAIESDEEEGNSRKAFGAPIDDGRVELWKKSDCTDAAIDVREVIDEMVMLHVCERFEKFFKHLSVDIRRAYDCALSFDAQGYVWAT